MIYTVTFNPAIDYVVRLDSPLEVGEVNRARGEDCVLGGKGINVSGVLAELGCKSVALGFVAGETGAWLERGLAAQGLHTDFVHLENGMTRINVKIKAGQETELNGAGPDIPESAMQELEKKLEDREDCEKKTVLGRRSVMIDPGEIYTLTELSERVREVTEQGKGIILCRQRKETEDAALVDAAVAFGIGQMKLGSPGCLEAAVKYNRLLKLEEKLGKSLGTDCP